MAQRLQLLHGLPRPQAGGFVQFLDPGESDVAATLVSTDLFAYKVAEAVDVRFETQSWAWRAVPPALPLLLKNGRGGRGGRDTKRARTS